MKRLEDFVQASRNFYTLNITSWFANSNTWHYVDFEWALIRQLLCQRLEKQLDFVMKRTYVKILDLGDCNLCGDILHIIVDFV